MMELFASGSTGEPNVAINQDQVCVALLQPNGPYIEVHTLKWSMTVYPLEGETLEEAWARLTKRCPPGDIENRLKRLEDDHPGLFRKEHGL